MLISEKQQEANRRNAQHSSGPVTPEGKEAVRLNALKYGLRARDTILPGEDVEEYKRFWDDLEADWQPQTRTERLHVETIATSQWLLARVAKIESRIYQSLSYEYHGKDLARLQLVSKQRVYLERSCRTAIADLKQLQKERQSRPQPRPQPAPAATRSAAQPPTPAYPVPEVPQAHAVFTSPVTPDSR